MVDWLTEAVRARVEVAKAKDQSNNKACGVSTIIVRLGLAPPRNGGETRVGVCMQLSRGMAPMFWDEFLEALWELTPVLDYERGGPVIELELVHPSDDLSYLAMRDAWLEFSAL